MVLTQFVSVYLWNRVVRHEEKTTWPPRLSLKENQLAKLLAFVEGLENEAEGSEWKCSKKKKKMCKAKRMPLALYTKRPRTTHKRSGRKSKEPEGKPSVVCSHGWKMDKGSARIWHSMINNR